MSRLPSGKWSLETAGPANAVPGLRDEHLDRLITLSRNVAKVLSLGVYPWDTAAQAGPGPFIYTPRDFFCHPKSTESMSQSEHCLLSLAKC